MHIFDPAQGAMTYYCQSCRRAIVPETSMRCPGCNTSEHQFLTTGLCGCEDCYSVFRNSIIQGIESYRKEVFTRTGRFRLPGGTALARLQTYFEIKKSDAGDRQPESVAEPWPENLMQPDPAGNIEALELKSGEVQFRIRMARNIPGLPYAADEHSQFLEDVFLSSKGFLSDIWPGSQEGIQTAATIGDEDHFRFSWSWITDGEMRAAESRVASVLRQIRALDQAFVWQYSTVFGYLTGCPT
ncbi:MAG: hypothetical protein KDK37_07860, partial [Leptospiraceae bacterium]|nr:hypothetical protein [Leptospiraceae bacterium]